MSNNIFVKRYFKPEEFKQEIYDSKDRIFEKGLSCGWDEGDRYVSFKAGCSTYIYSHPAQGKTVFVTETLIHLAKNHNQYICIYSPEMGERKDVVWNLIQVYVGKRLFGEDAYRITDKEIDDAMEFINEHFLILENNVPDHIKKNNPNLNLFSVKDVYRQIFKAEQDYGKKVNIVCIDPFNLLDREPDQVTAQEHNYVANVLKFINEKCKEWGIHTILVSHLRAPVKNKDQATGVEYFPIPYPDELAGGQTFYRMGFQMIAIWRPPFGLCDKAGIPYEENITRVIVQKTKPFGVGKIGQFDLHYDLNTHTLYERYADSKYRCGEIEKKGIRIHNYTGSNTSLKPSPHWDEPMKTLDEEVDLF